MSPTASNTSASAGLSVRGLAVTYGDLRAVDGVDLEVAAGEVVALLGASGSGKSSLLRAVAGLEDVAAGEVAWDGRSMVRVPVHKRGFGLMFQDGQLFEHRDVGSNIAYGLTGLPRAQRGERVREMLELVGLPGFERRRVTTLSGGQAQRVALARALAPAPRLLLLDEPLSALDRALREQLATDVRTILRQGGTTALYVTHDQDEAMTVADRVGVMEAGRLLRLDTPQRLWADPGSSKVARFLGFDVAGDLALAPGALRVVEAAAGEPGEPGEPDGPAQTEIPATPETLPATLPATVLASRLRRGQWEAEVELDPERLAELTNVTEPSEHAEPAGRAELADVTESAEYADLVGLAESTGPTDAGIKAVAERHAGRVDAGAAVMAGTAGSCEPARATALTRRPHAPGARVALSLDPARTARL